MRTVLTVLGVAATTAAMAAGGKALIGRKGVDPGFVNLWNEWFGDQDQYAYSAVQQRFRKRREVIAAMQSDLRGLVVAESAWAAKEGYPTSALPPRAWRPSPNVLE